MIYRTVAVFIVLFWLTMTALLLHQQLRPSDSALREIPVSHVVKLMFMRHQDPHQEKDSPLVIYSDKTRVGQLSINPKIDPRTQEHDLELSGFLQVAVPGAKRDRVKWEGLVHMDKLLNIKQFELKVETHTPTDLETDLEVLPKENLVRYQISSHGVTADRQDFTIDARGVRAALDHAGIDPALLPVSWKPQAAGEFSAKARLSSLSFHGAQLDTYQVTVESNGQTLLDCHVDQLGRVVHATTLLGYTVEAE